MTHSPADIPNMAAIPVDLPAVALALPPSPPSMVPKPVPKADKEDDAAEGAAD
jgi:hypothetical protein